MYKLTGVTKDYRKDRGTVAALRGIDLVIEDGEWLAIQCPTGHGKSTLLQNCPAASSSAWPSPARW
jgi:putative ABC transport system ATP-binding protein